MTERLIRLGDWLERLRNVRRLALDTSAVIYNIEGVLPHSLLTRHIFRLMEHGAIVGQASTIVEMEMLVKPLRERDGQAVDRVELFFSSTPNLAVRGVDQVVGRRAAQVRASTGLPMPDAIIVATALEERCDAIVGNDRRMASHVTSIPYLCLDDFTQ